MEPQTLATEEGVTITITPGVVPVETGTGLKSGEVIWDNMAQYDEYTRVSKLTNGQMLKEFHTAFNAFRDKKWVENPQLETLATKLIMEEFKEFLDEEDSQSNILKELADLVYVCYGYADRFGWDLDEAVRRVHISNMSKLDDDGKPIFREDGKILKSTNYKAPDLRDLV